MNAVGIDVSKGKSTVAILRPLGEIVRSPFDVKHTHSDIASLIKTIVSIPGESRVVMEHTGHYHEPLLQELTKVGLFVSAVNPKLIKDFSDNSLRKVKSDKADAFKIARYTLHNWHDLKPYSIQDEYRSQLKLMNRQFGFYTKQKVAQKDNFISILDQTFPGINKFFKSPVRKDGHQKWVDFATNYWHIDCVREKSLNAFIDHYKKWCKRNHYHFCKKKAKEVYEHAREIVAVLPKTTLTKQTVQRSAAQVNTISREVEELRTLMDETTAKLPEYPVVLEMEGVGRSLGPQLIAEIGDVRRFTHRAAITAFAGVDPGVDESGTHARKSVPTSKKGSSPLRKTLFLVMSALLQTKPEDDKVYEFLNKKRSEGKPYYVYMTAGANKFLRIYYGRVREHLASMEEQG